VTCHRRQHARPVAGEGRPVAGAVGNGRPVAAARARRQQRHNGLAGG
jgi:hypothetical protein